MDYYYEIKIVGEDNDSGQIINQESFIFLDIEKIYLSTAEEGHISRLPLRLKLGNYVYKIDKIGDGEPQVEEENEEEKMKQFLLSKKNLGEVEFCWKESSFDGVGKNFELFPTYYFRIKTKKVIKVFSNRDEVIDYDGFYCYWDRQYAVMISQHYQYFAVSKKGIFEQPLDPRRIETISYSVYDINGKRMIPRPFLKGGNSGTSLESDGLWNK